MSRARPSERDRLEAEYLALARERSALAEELAKKDAQLLAMQAKLDGVESRRMPERMIEVGPRVDAVDRLVQGGRGPQADLREELGLSRDEADEVGMELREAWGRAGEGSSEYRIKALRMSALLLGVCNLAEADEQPKLVIRLIRLAADLPGAVSMRTLAEEYGLSAERVSQRVEEYQRRFNLPANRHNKSAAAVDAYRVNAALTKQRNTQAA